MFPSFSFFNPYGNNKTLFKSFLCFGKIQRKYKSDVIHISAIESAESKVAHGVDKENSYIWEKNFSFFCINSVITYGTIQIHKSVCLSIDCKNSSFIFIVQRLTFFSYSHSHLLQAPNLIAYIAFYSSYCIYFHYFLEFISNYSLRLHRTFYT